MFFLVISFFDFLIVREVWAHEQLRVYVHDEARQHRMEQTQYMDVVLRCFFSHGSIKNGYQGVL